MATRKKARKSRWICLDFQMSETDRIIIRKISDKIFHFPIISIIGKFLLPPILQAGPKLLTLSKIFPSGIHLPYQIF
jgi:hypothetical protein